MSEWAKTKLLTQQLSYGDYIQALTRLQASTRDTVRTRRIFRAALEQANQVGQSSGWVEMELHFEALSEFVQDRGELLLMKLAHGGLVGDAALDLCNEQSS